MTRPPIKWAGGKAHMADALRPLILERLSREGRYREVFAGGCAVALSMPPDTPTTVTDANRELIVMWQSVRRDPAAVHEELSFLSQLHTREYYYQVRARLPELMEPFEVAARFIYLNKMGFNGLYRVNRSGQFNVPLGRGRVSSIPTKDDLEQLRERVASWTIECGDFRTWIRAARPGDVIYADPPYDGTFDYASGFDDEARETLSVELRIAARRGIGVIVTDADTPRTRKLYSWMDLRSTAERRRVAANGDRSPAACIIGVRP